MSKLEQFAKWAFDIACEAQDIDGSDIQDKLEELGLIERKDTNPETNEWGAEWLYYWKGETDWLQSQVIVIEEGEEPQVGDLLLSTKGQMGGISCGYLFEKRWRASHYGGEYNEQVWTITPRFGDRSQIGKHWANPKEWQTILARICSKDNVLKPVVVRKKTSEGI